MKAREITGEGARDACTNRRRDEARSASFVARPLRALSFAARGPYTGGVLRARQVGAAWRGDHMNEQATTGSAAARSVPWLWGALSLLLAACGTTPATPEQQAQAERRLLIPFLADRSVGCDQLLVELTGNFDANVTRPAVDARLHDFRREVGEGFVDLVWTNRSGAPAGAFQTIVGEKVQEGEQGWRLGRGTRFRVVNQLRVRVFEGRRELTLRATTTGDYALVQDGKSKPRDLRRFCIPDDVPAAP
jgi:hypothetical protein